MAFHLVVRLQLLFICCPLHFVQVDVTYSINLDAICNENSYHLYYIIYTMSFANYAAQRLWSNRYQRTLIPPLHFIMSLFNGLDVRTYSIFFHYLRRTLFSWYWRRRFRIIIPHPAIRKVIAHQKTYTI